MVISLWYKVLDKKNDTIMVIALTKLCIGQQKKKYCHWGKNSKILCLLMQRSWFHIVKVVSADVIVQLFISNWSIIVKGSNMLHCTWGEKNETKNCNHTSICDKGKVDYWIPHRLDWTFHQKYCPSVIFKLSKYCMRHKEKLGLYYRNTHPPFKK